MRKGKVALYVQYTDPSAIPPLEHSSGILAGSGWRIRFFGVRFRGAGGIRLAEREGVTVRLVEPRAPGPGQKLHYGAFLVGAFAEGIRCGARVIYASDTLIAPVAYALSFWPGWKVVYHEHDSYSGPPASVFLAVCLWARERLLRGRAAVVFPTASRLALAERGSGKIPKAFVVMNCPRQAELEGVGEAEGEDRGPLRLYYHGSIVPGRLPLTLVDAMAGAGFPVTLTVLGFEPAGGKGHIERFRSYAASRGVGERVDFLGAVGREEMLRIARGHDVGLCLLPLDSGDVNEANSAGGSNKAFEYLARGMALLVPAMADWREMFVESGCGVACDPGDAESIGEALARFASDRAGMREMARRGAARLEGEWNYERQFSPLQRYLEAGEGR